MHGISAIDQGRSIDWSGASLDYATWRPDYPQEFYDRLSALGVGLPDQRILDLGTGVGFLALEFARRGAGVVGVDVAVGQLEQAKRRAGHEGLKIAFRECNAEDTGLPTGFFDVVTASQCWLYFDREKMLPELRRLCKPPGLLVTSHFCWLPREDEVARASEQLVRKYNPDWSAHDWSGVVPPMPSWAKEDFELKAMFTFDVDVPFSRESWRGRMRACRGIGATLGLDEVDAFDAEHAQMLEGMVGQEFTVRHRVDAHFLRPLGEVGVG